MTLFEYLSVAVSIVLSLGVAQVLGSLRALFGPRRDPLLTLWVALLLVAHALLWWTLWSYRDAVWDFGRFLLALLTALSFDQLSPGSASYRRQRAATQPLAP